ncbi:MAG: UDP-3-O-(3-hydroxymyristoyl)glucosamine N-acyltransferase [Gammaproteobacteria bacterium]|nr:UDP-3-O-(3-hydroxymyristoyl)glucosamine N-acyltransferase [Gammaproteobacteria bacterium]
MRLTLADLAARCDLELAGTAAAAITGVCGLSDDLPDCISFIINRDQVAAAARSRIPAFVTRPDALIPGKHNLLHQHPEIAICRVAAMFAPVAYTPSTLLAANASIAASAQLGADVIVGPGVVIGERVVIGARTRLLPGSIVLDDVRIGADCLLYPRVVVREQCQLGDRVIIQPGAVIGGDGFGFVTDAAGNPIKVPQVGRVIIGDDVELGANSTIDRARFTDTVIGRGTKIDNLVIVAHNVRIGENCLIAAQCGIAGSSRLGDRVRLGGQVGVIGHVAIGDDVVVLAQSLVTKDLAQPGTYAGTPAMPARAWRAAVARFRRAGRSRGC